MSGVKRRAKTTAMAKAIGYGIREPMRRPLLLDPLVMVKQIDCCDPSIVRLISGPFRQLDQPPRNRCERVGEKTRNKFAHDITRNQHCKN